MFLTETQYLIDTHRISESEWAEKLAGQKLSFDAFDLYKLRDRVPADATDGAEFIRQQVPGCLSHNADSKTWYVWNGKIHTPLTAKTVPLQLIDILGSAFKFLNAFLAKYAESEIKNINAMKLDAETTKKEIADFKARLKAVQNTYSGFAFSLNSNKGVKDVLDKLERKSAKGKEYFQNDRQWLVVRNGVIDLEDYRKTKTVALLPHSAERPVYRYFDADFDPATTHDAYVSWRKFLASSIVDWDTVLLLQKAVGAAFSAEEKPRALFNLLGAPASGKSVFLSVFNRLGQAYSVMPNNQAIQLNNGDTNFYQDDLRGARFVGFSEVQGKKPLDDGFIKGVLGGDEQKTRRMRQDTNEWKPQCVLFIASNMPLKFNTRDEATFIKILPIPFPHSFTDVDPLHKMDRELESKVLAERSGILHWVLEGMLLFWEQGLAPTAAVMAAMDGNKTANSSALQFIESMLDAGHIIQDNMAPLSGCLSAAIAYDMFRTWAEAQGIKNVPGKQTFNADIADFYHGKDRSNGVRFCGLSMAPHFVQNVQTGVSHLSLAKSL